MAADPAGAASGVARRQKAVDRAKAKEDMDHTESRVLSGIDPAPLSTPSLTAAVPLPLSFADTVKSAVRLQKGNPSSSSLVDATMGGGSEDAGTLAGKRRAAAREKLKAAAADATADRERSQAAVQASLDRAHTIIAELKQSLTFVKANDESGEWLPAALGGTDELANMGLQRWVDLCKQRHNAAKGIRLDVTSNLAKYERLQLFESDVDTAQGKDLLVPAEATETMMEEMAVALGLTNVNGKWIRKCDCEGKLERIRTHVKDHERRLTKAKLINSFVKQLDAMVSFVNDNVEQVRQGEAVRLQEILDLRQSNQLLTTTVERQRGMIAKLKSTLKEAGVKSAALEDADDPHIGAMLALATKLEAAQSSSALTAKRSGGKAHRPHPHEERRRQVMLSRMAALERHQLFALDFDGKEDDARSSSQHRPSSHWKGRTTDQFVQTLSEQEVRQQLMSMSVAAKVLLSAKPRGQANQSSLIEELRSASSAALPFPGWSLEPLPEASSPKRGTPQLADSARPSQTAADSAGSHFPADTRVIEAYVMQLGKAFTDAITQLETTRAHTLQQVAECVVKQPNQGGPTPSGGASVATSSPVVIDNVGDVLGSVFSGSTSTSRMVVKKAAQDAKNALTHIALACKNLVEKFNKRVFDAGELAQSIVGSPTNGQRPSFAHYVAGLPTAPPLAAADGALGSSSSGGIAASVVPNGNGKKTASSKKSSDAAAGGVSPSSPKAAKGAKSSDNSSKAAGKKAVVVPSESSPTTLSNEEGGMGKSGGAASRVPSSSLGNDPSVDASMRSQLSAPLLDASLLQQRSRSAMSDDAASMRVFAEDMAESAKTTLDPLRERVFELEGKLQFETSRAEEFAAMVIGMRGDVVAATKRLVGAAIPGIDNGICVEMELTSAPKDMAGKVKDWRASVDKAMDRLALADPVVSADLVRSMRVLHTELVAFFATTGQIGLGSASVGVCPGDLPGETVNTTKLSSMIGVVDGLSANVSALRVAIRKNALGMKAAERSAVEDHFVPVLEVGRSLCRWVATKMPVVSSTASVDPNAPGGTTTTENDVMTLGLADVNTAANANLMSSDEASELTRVQGDQLKRVAESIENGLDAARELLPLIIDKMQAASVADAQERARTESALVVAAAQRECEVLKAELVKTNRKLWRAQQLGAAGRASSDVDANDATGIDAGAAEAASLEMALTGDTTDALRELDKLFAARVETAKRSTAQQLATVKADAVMALRLLGDQCAHTVEIIESEQRELFERLRFSSLRQCVGAYVASMRWRLEAQDLIPAAAAVDDDGTGAELDQDDLSSPAIVEANLLETRDADALSAAANRIFERVIRPRPKPPRRTLDVALATNEPAAVVMEVNCTQTNVVSIDAEVTAQFTPVSVDAWTETNDGQTTRASSEREENVAAISVLDREDSTPQAHAKSAPPVFTATEAADLLRQFVASHPQPTVAPPPSSTIVVPLSHAEVQTDDWAPVMMSAALMANQLPAAPSLPGCSVPVVFERPMVHEPFDEKPVVEHDAVIHRSDHTLGVAPVPLLSPTAMKADGSIDTSDEDEVVEASTSDDVSQQSTSGHASDAEEEGADAEVGQATKKTPNRKPLARQVRVRKDAVNDDAADRHAKATKMEEKQAQAAARRAQRTVRRAVDETVAPEAAAAKLANRGPPSVEHAEDSAGKMAGDRPSTKASATTKMGYEAAAVVTSLDASAEGMTSPKHKSRSRRPEMMDAASQWQAQPRHRIDVKQQQEGPAAPLGEPTAVESSCRRPLNPALDSRTPLVDRGTQAVAFLTQSGTQTIQHHAGGGGGGLLAMPSNFSPKPCGALISVACQTFSKTLTKPDHRPKDVECITHPSGPPRHRPSDAGPSAEGDRAEVANVDAEEEERRSEAPAADRTPSVTTPPVGADTMVREPAAAASSAARLGAGKLGDSVRRASGDEGDGALRALQQHSIPAVIHAVKQAILKWVASGDARLATLSLLEATAFVDTRAAVTANDRISSMAATLQRVADAVLTLARTSSEENQTIGPAATSATFLSALSDVAAPNDDVRRLSVSDGSGVKPKKPPAVVVAASAPGSTISVGGESAAIVAAPLADVSKTSIPLALAMQLHASLIAALEELVKRLNFKKRVVVSDPFVTWTPTLISMALHEQQQVNASSSTPSPSPTSTLHIAEEVFRHDVSVLGSLHRLLHNDSVIGRRKVATALRQLAAQRRLEGMLAARREVSDSPTSRTVFERQEKKLRDALNKLGQMQHLLRVQQSRAFETFQLPSQDLAGAPTSLLPAMRMQRRRVEPTVVHHHAPLTHLTTTQGSSGGMGAAGTDMLTLGTPPTNWGLEFDGPVDVDSRHPFVGSSGAPVHRMLFARAFPKAQVFSDPDTSSLLVVNRRNTLPALAASPTLTSPSRALEPTPAAVSLSVKASVGHTTRAVANHVSQGGNARRRAVVPPLQPASTSTAGAFGSYQPPYRPDASLFQSPLAGRAAVISERRPSPTRTGAPAGHADPSSQALPR